MIIHITSILLYGKDMDNGQNNFCDTVHLYQVDELCLFMVSLLICCLSCRFEPVCCRHQDLAHVLSSKVRLMKLVLPERVLGIASKNGISNGKTAASEAQLLKLIRGNSTN